MEIPKKPFSFVEFIKTYISYEPLYPWRIGEPEEHLGLSVVSFPPYKNKQIHIECGELRDIYCECIDYNKYVEGTVIPLNENDQRHIILDYTQLKNKDDAEKISAIINGALTELYSPLRTNVSNMEIFQIAYRQLMHEEYIKEILQRLRDQSLLYGGKEFVC